MNFLKICKLLWLIRRTVPPYYFRENFLNFVHRLVKAIYYILPSIHRAPELMFQPSMMGNLEAGLAETMEYVFKHFSPEDQLLLANNVFLTGGSSQFPGEDLHILFTAFLSLSLKLYFLLVNSNNGTKRHIFEIGNSNLFRWLKQLRF